MINYLKNVMKIYRCLFTKILEGNNVSRFLSVFGSHRKLKMTEKEEGG